MGLPCRSYANKCAPAGVCLWWLEHSHQQPSDWRREKNWWILGLNIQPRRQTVIYKGYKRRREVKMSLPHLTRIPPPPNKCHHLPTPKVSACCFCSYRAASEWSSLTFGEAQNWISSLILRPRPSPCLIHAVTNWVACQRPGCVNGRLQVKAVCHLSSVSFSISPVVYQLTAHTYIYRCSGCGFTRATIHVFFCQSHLLLLLNVTLRA